MSSMEALNAKLDANAVAYELPRPQSNGVRPKRPVFDASVPPPKVTVRKTTDFSDELRSLIELSISESQAKSKQQLGQEIAKALQVAFDKNSICMFTRRNGWIMLIRIAKENYFFHRRRNMKNQAK